MNYVFLLPQFAWIGSGIFLVLGYFILGAFEKPYIRSGMGVIHYGDPSHDYREPRGPFTMKAIFEEANTNVEKKMKRGQRWGSSDNFFRIPLFFEPGHPMSLRFNTFWGTKGYLNEPMMLSFIVLLLGIIPTVSGLVEKIFLSRGLREFWGFICLW